MKSLIITALLFALIAVIIPAAMAGDPIIAVFITRDLEPHREALAGFREELHDKGIKAVWDEYHLQGDPEERAEAARLAIKKEPALIFALGTSATQIAAQTTSRIPIVFANVLNPRAGGIIGDYHGPNGNITGASLDFKPEELIALLGELQPDSRRIGLIYRSSDFNVLVDDITTALRNSGKELIPRRINDLEDLHKASGELLQQVDTFWMIADHQLFSRQTTRFLLLETMRRRIPFIGISPSYVRAGALFCIYWDSRDIGRQAGETAGKILRSIEPARIPVSRPRKKQIHINRAVAANLNIEIPDSVLEQAVDSNR
jgi:putative tryptophan/tyrosine transport system substrate-binding protein